ncbi:hypothetical protein J7373_05630 [Xanthomonas sp. A2111]|uniref:Uncharacterized protein n=1 Tax=Xanthomonas hawaiiensis TaxID=3003247 RepID=A0ABU2I7Q6_9XANT|nr:hypothetical protein [Xanthomonas sp. A2111]MBO9827729.1 hypothetical protein [Xanthomonas sp. A2111]MDS9994181.1 hypothetical protein [Xanthomonas sp. A2111]
MIRSHTRRSRAGTATWRALTLLALALPTCAAAQWHDPQGRALPDSAERGHDKAFAAALQIADDADFATFAQEWGQTEAAHAPNLRTIARVRRGQLVRVALLYSGCAPSPNNGGACDAQMSLRMLGPDGSTTLQDPMRPLGTGGPPAAAGLLELAPLSVQLRFEDSDPLGTYTVQVTVNDPSQDAWVRLQTQVELVGDR